MSSYFNHSPRFQHRRTIVTILREEFGIVARMSDSTEYLEQVLEMAEEDRVRAIEVVALANGAEALVGSKLLDAWSDEDRAKLVEGLEIEAAPAPAAPARGKLSTVHLALASMLAAVEPYKF